MAKNKRHFSFPLYGIRNAVVSKLMGISQTAKIDLTAKFLKHGLYRMTFKAPASKVIEAILVPTSYMYYSLNKLNLIPIYLTVRLELQISQP